MEYVIETSALTKKYGALLAVNGVSLHVKKGEIYGLIGKNGAGKTTLMRLLLGLSKANSGEIRLLDSTELNGARRRIGALIEAPALYKNETAIENMRRFAMLGEKITEGEITRILDFVGLGDTGKKKVGKFSLGMRQRLGIAIALLGNPELLILDEPVNGLDPAGIRDVRDVILKLKEQGVSVLISSHLLDELGKIATTYGIMSYGRLMEELSAEEVKAKCSTSIKIAVDNVEGTLKILNERYPMMKTEPQPGFVRITTPVYDLSELNSLLVYGGIRVYELKNESLALEEFFIERMGR